MLTVECDLLGGTGSATGTAGYLGGKSYATLGVEEEKKDYERNPLSLRKWVSGVSTPPCSPAPLKIKAVCTQLYKNVNY